MKLKRNEPCPIHKGQRNCCGRSQFVRIQQRKYVSVEQGVRQIPDVTIARGYRELRSKAAMRKLLVQKIKEQNGACHWCHKAFEDFNEVVPDHVEPRGMGAARRDDHPENIVASCGLCNILKGSRRGVSPCPENFA